MHAEGESVVPVESTTMALGFWTTAVLARQVEEAGLAVQRRRQPSTNARWCAADGVNADDAAGDGDGDRFSVRLLTLMHGGAGQPQTRGQPPTVITPSRSPTQRRSTERIVCGRPSNAGSSWSACPGSTSSIPLSSKRMTGSIGRVSR